MEFDRDLLDQALSALRKLVAHAREATDRSFDDGHSVDEWRSEEFDAAIAAADAVLAKAGVEAD